MTILETLAIFVGGPLVIYLAIALMSLLPGRKRRPSRYRPGQPWDRPAQWWSGDQPIAPVDPALAANGTEGGARGNW